MEITTTKDNGVLTLRVKGNLDTTTSPLLQAELEASFDGVQSLTMDFSELEYISSAGLRVLLMAHKRLLSGGGMLTVVGLNESVREVFEMTGFSDIFNLA